MTPRPATNTSSTPAGGTAVPGATPAPAGHRAPRCRHSAPRARAGWRRAAVLALAAAALAPLARAQGVVWRLRVRQTAPQPLRMITPSDPNFTGMLSSYFPGAAQTPGFAKAARPFVVLLQNPTALPAVAYAVVWKERMPTGQVVTHYRDYVNWPLRMPPTSYIPPQGVRLVSWVKSISPERYQRSPAAYAPWLGPRFFSEGRAGATLASVTLDGVVYSDGTFAGPDTTGVLQSYVVHRWAARDVATAPLAAAFLASGRPAAEGAAASSCPVCSTRTPECCSDFATSCCVACVTSGPPPGCYYIYPSSFAEVNTCTTCGNGTCFVSSSPGGGGNCSTDPRRCVP